ncbi:MAG: tRNA dihydrouridine synthase DusB [Saprospiraceae bacterium]|uniref:tRNA dihydrouridine synthase DusB n=1 Tax=Candidatus Brachybacter algidus TaxID=2982024 RepID=UPI001B4E6710|nr:tRNA dihydrouridine synthase DusB [Candidatus Brachybacter algidus]MBP8892196.1 tRNA dihydrouridine synthase DusB [Saprospiraceae bacterium]MBK7604294.1 tRNA dihydrouridine synthase DusB [Candidatus Brachybacter algidus]MBK8841386.1 tRNA dihydrouridine synthase DusB [Candidatus Brachybacter algidus]MBK9023180.1 tRNA dihydrouridine synthase DusB [Candidatus Brachybacter algidus]MBK9396567.1 tRNA dihydrouridine synthase DusB [Candidatus Brachybacter algidus]
MVKIGDISLGQFPLLLAPMEDVSDPPFRALCKEQGCDMVYTEFISVEGLIRNADKSIQKLDISDEERPVGIQIFGSDEQSMVQAAEIIERTKPEVLDINYGCPVKKVVCKMAGAGILQDINRMVSLTKAVVNATSLPVTVKTRLGWDDNTKNIVEVAERLQDIGIQALSIHGRTRKQMYTGEADWSLIAKVKENPRMHIPIFGNGDIDSPQKAKLYKERYGVDGIMIGRASIGNPWIFREMKQFLDFGTIAEPPTLDERISAVLQHLHRSIIWKGQKIAINEMRRHYTNYFRGYREVKQFRSLLVNALSYQEVEDITATMREYYSNEPLLV